MEGKLHTERRLRYPWSLDSLSGSRLGEAEPWPWNVFQGILWNRKQLFTKDTQTAAEKWANVHCCGAETRESRLRGADHCGGVSLCSPGTPYIDQACIKLMTILLPQRPECLDYGNKYLKGFSDTGTNARASEGKWQ